ncbi:MAG: tRNA lysidine(34) synthetase TilS [Bacteroidales bacterium]|nr:tRNA lysidine(34) synthetase TilS [Bacteroidales bacterium]
MRILLAVSGGIDSMYLANRAPELFPGASFAVAHCNFSLRGEESDGDEEFVRGWCAERGISFFGMRFDTAAYASEKGISIEMAARELRYGWFARICREEGFDALAVAHNANDNAETLMLNLLRGTGSKGLRGMAAVGSLPTAEIDGQVHSGDTVFSAAVARLHSGDVGCADPTLKGPPSYVAEGGTVSGVDLTTRCSGTVSRVDRITINSDTKKPILLRPLLKTSRAEIEQWMTKNGCRWREDRTNADSDFKRNKIRNLVFPLFAEINPSFIRTLSEDMERFAEVDDIAEDLFRESGLTLPVKVDSLLEHKRWKYLLWRLLEPYGFSQPTFDKLTRLLERYKDAPRGTVTLGSKSFESPKGGVEIKKGILHAFWKENVKK